MNASIKFLGIDRLPVEERLALVEQIWDSIATHSSAEPLTESQRTELQKRLEFAAPRVTAGLRNTPALSPDAPVRSPDRQFAGDAGDARFQRHARHCL